MDVKELKLSQELGLGNHARQENIIIFLSLRNNNPGISANNIIRCFLEGEGERQD